MRIRSGAAVASAGIAGLLAGAVLTLSIQGDASIPEHAPRLAAPHDAFAMPERPDTFLAWTAGGLPEGFAAAARATEEIRRLVVVASDTAWLTRSINQGGEVVDDPPQTFAIPLEVAAVDPDAYAPFLPPADRGVTVALQRGQAILGESSAKLRGLGPGAELRFGKATVQVAAILPDELVGAHEVLVSRETGSRLGVSRDRYALLVPRTESSVRSLTKTLRRVLPPGTLLRLRAPGDTPYFRQGDAVLPPVIIKELFGEFAAKPRPGQPGFLTLDPVWVRTHITTERVPLLGDVTCNVALFPQIRGAIGELVDRGLSDTVTSFSGCYAARRVNRIPTAGISHHSWGIALDINVPQNPFGSTPNQHPRMVAAFERWGFIWGGSFIQPDGMHFEYRRPPASS